MAFDLGLFNHISGIFLAAATTANPTTGAIETDLYSRPTTDVWSNRYALDLNDPDALLPDPNDPSLPDFSKTRGGAVLPNYSDPIDGKNYQINALYDFLSLYSVTRNNSAEPYGWDDLEFENGDTPDKKNKIRAALFGDGTKQGSLIKGVLIGGTRSKEATHQRMGEVLDALDIENDKERGHHNHFHVYLRPLDAIGIEEKEGDKLLASAELNSLEDVQTLRNQQPERVIDAEYHICQTLAPTFDPSWKEINIIRPGIAGSTYFKSKELVYDWKQWKSLVDEGPQHGKLEPITEEGGDFPINFRYVPEAGYFGPDQITFILEAEGKRFKVIESVYVVNGVPEYGHPGCESSFDIEEIKMTDDPQNGSSQNIIELPTDSALSTGVLEILCQFFNVQHNAVWRIDYDRQI